MPWNTWRRPIGILSALVVVGAAVISPWAASSGRAANTGKPTSVSIYLIAIGDNGKSGTRVGCGDSLVAVKTHLDATRAPLTATLRKVVGDHRRFFGQSELYNALFQSRLELMRATVVHGTASIHLTGQLRLGGVCDAPRVRAQLRHAGLQFPTVQRVFVYVNGILLSKALSSR
jgi:hypothetical protein